MIDRRDNDILIENECLRSLKVFLNTGLGVESALMERATLGTLALSVDSAYLPSRRVVMEMLTFFAYYQPPLGNRLILGALKAVARVRGDASLFGGILRQVVEACGSGITAFRGARNDDLSDAHTVKSSSTKSASAQSSASPTRSIRGMDCSFVVRLPSEKETVDYLVQLAETWVDPTDLLFT